jgi:hypothetical protein
MTKATSPDKDSKTDTLNTKKNLIQKFIDLKDLAESNPKEMVNCCLKLL